VTSLDALYQALPIASALISYGSQTSCGGLARARIDLEPAAAYEFVDAVPPPGPEWHHDQELVDFCVIHVREGVETELTELFGELPTVRVVLHEVFPHQVDSNESVNRRAGRYVVRQALRNAGLADVPAPGGSYRLVRPRA
jgi:hypothetical protein